MADAGSLPVVVLMHEDATDRWFRVEPNNRRLEHGSFTYFDLPVLADNPNVSTRDTGSIELCILVGDDDAPDGEYVFVVGGDVSCPA